MVSFSFNDIKPVANKRVGNVKKKQEMKLFIVLFLCTAFVFSFSHFGASAYNAITEKSSGFSEGTSIGGVDVSGKSAKEALLTLTEQQQAWLSQTTIKLHYKEKSVPIDLNQFHFDLQSSVDMAKDGQKNELIVTFKSGDLYQYLQSLSSRLRASVVNIEALQNELVALAAGFNTGEHDFNAQKFLLEAESEDEVLVEASITPDAVPLELGFIVEELSSIKIEPKSQFSLLELLADKKFAQSSAEAASMIATVIYNAVLPSNFKIVEKHTSQALPEYVELGREAKVDFNNHLDFMFVNPNDSAYEIALKLENNTLTATLKGPSFVNDYQINLAEREEFKPKTIVQYSPLVAPNAVKVKEAGKNGLKISVYRQIYGENGEWLRKEFITEDFYPPVHRVEVHGLTQQNAAQETTDQPNDQTGTAPADSGNTVDSGAAGGTANTDPALTPQNPDKPDAQDDRGDDDLFGKPNEPIK
jgi:hypothetical protein